MARKYHQGKFKPINPNKYEGDWTNIFFRSSWEFHLARWCDKNPAVISWNSEEIVVPYFYDVDQRYHRYFVDFKVKLKTRSGSVKTVLIEVKPRAQRMKPLVEKITKKNEAKVYEYIKNQCKWKAADKYAKERGWEFMVLDEFDLGLKKE